jgi:hypothetical protein
VKKGETARASTILNGRPASKKPNGRSAGSHGQMADVASRAAFRPREAGTLNWLSGDMPVERAAELQAHHRGDLVKLEGAA